MRINGIQIKTAILILLFFAGSNIQKTYAQNFISESNNLYTYNLYPYSIFPHSVKDSINEENSSGEDTLVQEEKPKLLPDQISFGEKLFWGERGVFRGLGIASPLTPEVRKHELSVRRAMLNVHLIGGIVTLASMIGTAWTGQRTIDLPKNRALRNDHQKMVLATIITYSLTASMSILSPPPLIRRDEASTITIHKTLAWFHVAGMILTPILGSMVGTRSKTGPDINLSRARFHQYAGYLTTAVFAASMIVITF